MKKKLSKKELIKKIKRLEKWLNDSMNENETLNTKLQDIKCQVAALNEELKAYRVYAEVIKGNPYLLNEKHIKKKYKYLY